MSKKSKKSVQSLLKTRKFLAMIVIPSVTAGAVIILSTMNACSPSDQSTETREGATNAATDNAVSDTVAKNAAEAEAADVAASAKSGSHSEQVAKSQPSKEKAQASAKSAAKGKVASTEKHESARASRVPASAGGVYVVQVGAFKVKENAEKLEAKLKTAGFQVAMRTIEHSKNGTLHLVQFQPTSNRAEAETQIEELQAKQDLTAQILLVSKKQ